MSAIVAGVASPNSRASDAEALDRRHWVHPLSALRQHEAQGATLLTRGDGVFVEDSEGRRYLDGFAGLWCVNIGYSNARVVEAATRQMSELPYATGYFGMGSAASAHLAAELAAAAPGDLDRVFFTLGGSDAVDSVVRLVHRYNTAMGRPEKRHFIALERGYHGSSAISAGLTGLAAFHDGFGVPGPEQHHIPSPYPYRHPDGPDEEAIIRSCLAALEAKVAEIGPNRAAAFIMEPIQGGGGVIVPPRGFVRRMRERCRELGLLFIADEVVTGFGRTGPLFACEEEGVAPDFMTLAKGLTSGYVPMGAVLMSESVYRALADALPDGAPLGHGLTYSGHPVSAAVALEVLAIYREGMLDAARATGTHLQARLRELGDHRLVGNVRGRGMIGAVELVSDKARKTPLDPALGTARSLTSIGLRNGVIFRAFADGAIGVAPPLCMTVSEADTLVDGLHRTIDEFAGMLS